MAATAQSIYLPIAELSPYQNKWVIKARVTNKAPMRTFKKGAGEGKVFSVDLLDAEGGDIRASFFNDAAEKFFPVLTEKKIFTLSKGNIKVANKQFNPTSHRYELTFEANAMIVEVSDDAGIQDVKFNFVDLRSVQDKTLPCRVDICGVVTAFRPVTSVNSTKDGRVFTKRDITVVDDTATSMDVTLWAENATVDDAKFEGKPVVAIKGVLVKEFNSARSGSVVQGGTIQFQPEGSDADRVKKWWNHGGSTQNITTLSTNAGLGLVNLRDIQDKTLPCRVDLIGVLTAFRAVMVVTSQKDGREFTKRDVTIVDDTATSMDVTLWGDVAKHEDAKFEGSPVVSFKSVLIKEFNQSRNGSLLESGSLTFKPTGDDADRVDKWWNNGGSSTQVTSISFSGGGMSARTRDAQTCTLAELRLRAEQATEQPEHYNVVSRLALVQMRKQGETQPLSYKACAESRENGFPCNKKVDSSGFCGACGRAGKNAPRLNLRCRLADATDSTWLTTFHEPAQRLVQMTAVDISKLEEEGPGGREQLETLVKSKYFTVPMQITVRTKLGSYLGEPRTDTQCVDARPVDKRSHGRLLLKEINQLTATVAA